MRAREERGERKGERERGEGGWGGRMVLSLSGQYWLALSHLYSIFTVIPEHILHSKVFGVK